MMKIRLVDWDLGGTIFKERSSFDLMRDEISRRLNEKPYDAWKMYHEKTLRIGETTDVDLALSRLAGFKYDSLIKIARELEFNEYAREAVYELYQNGIKQAIISLEPLPVVDVAANRLGMDFFDQYVYGLPVHVDDEGFVQVSITHCSDYVGENPENYIFDKTNVLDHIAQNEGLEPDEVAIVSDRFDERPFKKYVGIAMNPETASMIENARYVTRNLYDVARFVLSNST